ncbi:melanoma-derived growth regulatory protein isoform X1 [Hyperolius riggenbachi]|uniref:melanoma-derived growth regulatory protein isoform X1 n=1 Tax=Hyperolius riggenbachi TaxID=752182 RepID=UPI0035A32795
MPESRKRRGRKRRSSLQTTPAAQSPITALFRPKGAASKMASDSPSLPSTPDQTPALFSPASPPELQPADLDAKLDHLLNRMHRVFRQELSAAVADLSGQIGEVGERVATLEKQTDSLTEAVNADKLQIDEQAQQIEELQIKLEDLENRTRRANLRIRGVPESIADLKPMALNLFSALLPNLDPAELRIVRIHRALTKPKNRDLPRDIVLKLQHEEHRDTILNAARGLTPLPDPISMAVALSDYISPDCRFISVRRGQTLYIYSKLKGRGRLFWLGSVQGDEYGEYTARLGYFPSTIVQEEHYLMPGKVEVKTDQWDFMCQ